MEIARFIELDCSRDNAFGCPHKSITLQEPGRKRPAGARLFAF